MSRTTKPVHSFPKGSDSIEDIDVRRFEELRFPNRTRKLIRIVVADDKRDGLKGAKERPHDT